MKTYKVETTSGYIPYVVWYVSLYFVPYNMPGFEFTQI